MLASASSSTPSVQHEESGRGYAFKCRQAACSEITKRKESYVKRKKGRNDFMWQLIGNIFLVGFFEVLYLVAFVLMFTGERDLLELNRENIAKICIPVFMVAVLDETLQHYHVDKNAILGISIVMVFLSIVLTYRFKEKKLLIKVFLGELLAFVILVLLETVYYPLVLNHINRTIYEINANVLYNFLLSFPERIAEYSIIFIIVKFNVIKNEVIDEIIKDKKMLATTSVTLLCILLFMGVMGQLIIVDRILIHLSLITQLLTVFVVVTLPVWVLAPIYTTARGIAEKEKEKQKKEKKMSETEFNFLADRLKTYAKSGNYDKIVDVLEDIRKVIT